MTVYCPDCNNSMSELNNKNGIYTVYCKHCEVMYKGHIEVRSQEYIIHFSLNIDELYKNKIIKYESSIEQKKGVRKLIHCAITKMND